MYRFPFIFGGILLILIIGLFLVFGGHGKKSPTTPNPIKSLPSYANTDAQVIMTQDGLVNGDDAHRAIRVTISRDQRDLDVIQGYSGHVIQHRQLYNTQNAYSVFLKAIDNNGFLVTRKGAPADLDDQGQCPQGERFIYELKQDGKTLSRLWASSCSRSIGNLGGLSEVLQSLFQAQITNYDTLTENVQLFD